MALSDPDTVAASASQARARRSAGMVLVAILSVQLGSALATTAFDQVGPAGTVLLRSAFAALILLPIVRPTLDRRLVRDAFAFGFVLAAMNLSFYESIDRLPLGTAVTLEFLGPLGVALVGTRRPRDLVWVALAGGGVALLSGGIESGSELLGIALALTAAAFWATYILLSARLGSRHEGIAPLAVALGFSALLLTPAGVVSGGGDLLEPGVLATGLAVGLLSSAIPYGLELEALRRISSAVFGVLMSLEPAAAALIGFLALSQGLSAEEVVAVAMVVAASVGALRGAGLSRPVDD
jgi:inner membrane transporter RhtA